MCFSATASFSAAAVLIPVGIYCIKKSVSLTKPYWLLACVPLFFGVQQMLEGFVWLGFSHEGGGSGDTRLAALGFMFFSHMFWLIWIPLSCYAVEDKGFRKKLFFVLIFLGAAHGISMYLPLLFREDWLTVELIQHSIHYNATLVHDEYVPRIVMRILYALLVLVPLLIATDRYIKIFGVIIFISVVVATIFYNYAFISVWCYFAAILSFYILIMMLQKVKSQAAGQSI